MGKDMFILQYIARVFGSIANASCKANLASAFPPTFANYVDKSFSLLLASSFLIESSAPS